MKYKVVNRLFFRAAYSFSDLSQYYMHVVTQLQYYADGIKASGRKIEEEHKEKGREFDKQGQEEFERVFAEVWPGYFHNSFVTVACSQFEHEAKKLCAIIQEEHKMPVSWDEMEGPAPIKTKSYLNLAGVVLKDDPRRIELPPPDFKPTAVYDGNRTVISTIWNEFRYYYRVRNCIVHDNGLVERARGSSTLRKYVTEKGILNEKEGRPEIQLNKDFNVTVCDTMRKFFEKLMRAYYVTPLPD